MAIKDESKPTQKPAYEVVVCECELGVGVATIVDLSVHGLGSLQGSAAPFYITGKVLLYSVFFGSVRSRGYIVKTPLIFTFLSFESTAGGFAFSGGV